MLQMSEFFLSKCQKKSNVVFVEFYVSWRRFITTSPVQVDDGAPRARSARDRRGVTVTRPRARDG